jgi:hypothetical protein
MWTGAFSPNSPKILGELSESRITELSKLGELGEGNQQFTSNILNWKHVRAWSYWENKCSSLTNFRNFPFYFLPYYLLPRNAPTSHVFFLLKKNQIFITKIRWKIRWMARWQQWEGLRKPKFTASDAPHTTEAQSTKIRNKNWRSWSLDSRQVHGNRRSWTRALWPGGALLEKGENMRSTAKTGGISVFTTQLVEDRPALTEKLVLKRLKIHLL